MVYRLSKLALDHFRSWPHMVLDAGSGINILVGKNGIGKTNIVEAIEFLASGSSHRASASKFLVEKGQTKATIRANISHSAINSEARNTLDSHGATQHTLEVTIPMRGALRARLDSGSSKYFRDIAGEVKVVVFSPKDQQLVAGEPSNRRAFLDATATMMFPGYYDNLQKFHQISKQRTAVLKRLSEAHKQGMSDDSITLTELEVWTSQFIDAGLALTQSRRAVVESIASSFTQLYKELSSQNEHVAVRYEPSFDEILGDMPLEAAKKHISEHFQRIYPGEVARGANLIGPHRDDLSVLLEGEQAREYASNGELWTLGLAMKMAQFNYLAAEDTPILILDDVFAQLDETRRQQILAFAAQQQQVFITVAAHGDIPSIESSNLIDVEELVRECEVTS